MTFTQPAPHNIRPILAAADAAPDDLEALDQARRALAWWRDRLVKRQSCGKHGDRRRIRNQRLCHEVGEAYRQIVARMIALGWR